MKRFLPLFVLLMALPLAPVLAAGDGKSAVPDKIHAVAVFAGGCFWCMESEFQGLKGVSGVTSGYAGGPDLKALPVPTYEDVSTGKTGFIEAVAVSYDQSVVSYQQLLDIFWSNVDPFDDKGQFCDKGSQYLAAIFYASKDEEGLARASLKKIEESHGRKVATKIIPFGVFHPAEEYHQDYFEKNSVRYNLYKKGCGRDDRLNELKGGE